MIQPRTSPQKICKIFEKCPGACVGNREGTPDRRTAGVAERAGWVAHAGAPGDAAADHLPRARGPEAANFTLRSIHSGMRILTKLDRARSRLYRCQIFQVDMRWKALAEIYKIHSYFKLNFLFENRFKNVILFC